MARDGLTYDDVVVQTGLDARTLRGILHAAKRPHAKTLRRLADGMGVTVDELFSGDESAALAEFDTATNPAIRSAIEANPGLFDEWSPRDFGELSSRVGAGGPLTSEGVVTEARRMNTNRKTLQRAGLILESDQAELLRGVVDALHEKIEVTS